MNMLAMVKDPPSIPLERLSGSKTRSVQVGGQQGICTIDGYSMALVSEVAQYAFLSLENPQMRIL